MRIPTARPRIATADTRAVPRFRQLITKTTDAHYGTAAHKSWAAEVKRRAGARCQYPSHKGDRLAPNGIADHVVERMDGGAATALENGMWMCRACHAQKSAQARANRDAPLSVNSLHPQWLEPSRIPLTIVCGPPASGKTTYAKRLGGKVIDLDDIAIRISGTPAYACSRDVLGAAIRQRNTALGNLAKPGTACASAVLIVSEPTAIKRQWWATKLKPQAVVVCETPDSVCLQRIEADPDRAAYRETLSGAVMRWWAEYTPRRGDQIVRCW